MEWLKDNLYVIINILAIIASGVSAFILYKLGQWKQPVLDRIAELENSIKIKEAGTAVAAENRADRFGELKEEVAALRRERPNCEKHRMEFDGKLANLKLEIEQKLTTGECGLPRKDDPDACGRDQRNYEGTAFTRRCGEYSKEAAGRVPTVGAQG